MGVNYDKVSPEIRKKIEDWQKESNPAKQLQVLEDIADITQEMLGSIDLSNKSSKTAIKELGAVLLDIRESLEVLETREDPEIPDTSEKVVKSVESLKKGLESKLDKLGEKDPVINVAAPVVDVKTPPVNVSGITKALKTEIPNAFKSAIALIPEMPEADFTALEGKLDDVLDSLASIDTATRMKVQFPSSFEVSQLPSDDYDVLIATDSGDGNIMYIGKAVPGTLVSAEAWQIKEVDESSDVEFRFAGGSSAFTNAWDDRESLTY